MSGRGIYGTPRIAGDGSTCGSSWGTWIVGGLVVGGAVLWAKHQSDQVDKLYTTVGLPHQSFTESLAARTKELSSSAREKIHGITRRLGTRKEP
jgi:hypothetical protein